MNYRQQIQSKRRIRKRVIVVLCLAVFVYLFVKVFVSSDSEDVAPEITGTEEIEDVISLQEEGAASSGTVKPTVGGGRRDIYDRNLHSLATSFKLVSVYVRPLELKDSQRVVSQLAKLLDLNEGDLFVKMQNERRFVWLKRNIDAAKAREIADLGYEGVYLQDEWQRYYPYRHSAAHIIGFVKEEQALAGIEFFYDNVLRFGVDRDLSALELLGQKVDDLPDAGASLVLTIDINIQKNIEKKLQKLLETVQARAGMAVLMDVSTGEVIALANLPSYDPNKFWKHESYERRNRVILDPIPLGGFASYFRTAAELQAGNLPGTLQAGEQGSSHVIKARQRKVIRSKDLLAKNTLWQIWEPRVLLSPKFAWEADFLVSEADLGLYGRQIGIARQSPIDLPEHRYKGQDEEGLAVCNFLDATCQTTTINLLSAFAQILNHQKPAQPHLLKSLWYDQKMHPLFSSSLSAETKDARLRTLFEAFLEEQGAVTDQGNLVVETMVEEQDKIPDVEIAVAGEELPGKSREEAAQESTQKEKVYTALALGSTPPREDFHLALAVTLDGARVDLEKKSPVQAVVDEILTDSYHRLVQSLRKKNGMQPIELSRQDVYKRWEGIHDKEVSAVKPAAKTLSEGNMPDLRGFSLRKALQILEGYDLHIQISGSGTIVSQSPASGARVVEGDKCLLELKTDYKK